MSITPRAWPLRSADHLFERGCEYVSESPDKPPPTPLARPCSSQPRTSRHALHRLGGLDFLDGLRRQRRANSVFGRARGAAAFGWDANVARTEAAVAKALEARADEHAIVDMAQALVLLEEPERNEKQT